MSKMTANEQNVKTDIEVAMPNVEKIKWLFDISTHWICVYNIEINVWN